MRRVGGASCTDKQSLVTYTGIVDAFDRRRGLYLSPNMNVLREGDQIFIDTFHKRAKTLMA